MKLRRALQQAIILHGDAAAKAADAVMPFKRPSRQDAEEASEVVRHAAVLIVLFPGLNGWELALMQRTHYEGVHSGQIAVPGGEVDRHDTNLQATAMREFLEEMGVSIADESVVGCLSERYIPPSKFAVTPFVACLDSEPVWQLDTKEVAALLKADVNALAHPDALKQTSIPLRQGAALRLPAFEVEGHVVWGATALFLAEFAQVWRQLPRSITML